MRTYVFISEEIRTKFKQTILELIKYLYHCDNKETIQRPHNIVDIDTEKDNNNNNNNLQSIEMKKYKNKLNNIESLLQQLIKTANKQKIRNESLK